jgi:hypothetical protein
MKKSSLSSKPAHSTRSIPKLAKLSSGDKPRKHGLSRLERLLESSIRQELAIKGLRDSLMTLSLRVALLERGSVPRETFEFKPNASGAMTVSREYQIYVGGGGGAGNPKDWPAFGTGSGLDRNKP